MADFATVLDLERAWPGRTITGTADDEAATELLGYASLLLRTRFPTVDARITAGTLDADLARLATIQMVRRALEHPSTVVQRQSTGPFSVSYRDTAKGMVQITHDEVLLVGTGTPRAVGSFRLKAGLW